MLIDMSTHSKPVYTSLIVIGFFITSWLSGCSSQKPFEPSDNAPANPRDISGIPNAVPKKEPRSRNGNPESYVV